MKKILIFLFLNIFFFWTSIGLTLKQSAQIKNLKQTIESYPHGWLYVWYIDKLLSANSQEVTYLKWLSQKILEVFEKSTDIKVKRVLWYFYVKTIVTLENSWSNNFIKNWWNPFDFSPVTKFNSRVIWQDKSQLKNNNPSSYPVKWKKIIVSPWQSIQSAINRAWPWDIIMVRAWKYNEVLRIRKSWRKWSPIIITNYPWETPIITRENSNNSNEVTVLLENVKYIVFNWFHIYKPTYYWIWVRRSSEVVISNNEISYLNEQIPYIKRDWRSLEVMTKRNEPRSEHILITWNYIHHNHTWHKWSYPWDWWPWNWEALTFLGNIHNSVIENNKVEYNDYIWIDLIWHEEWGAFSIYPQPTHNIVRNNHTEWNAVLWVWYSHQIYFDWWLYNIIENNDAINWNDRGIEIWQEEAWPSGHHLIRNNLVTWNKDWQLTIWSDDIIIDVIFKNNIFRWNKILSKEWKTRDIKFIWNKWISDK
jgi:hypothetical protein